jgi:hypothetical protein
MMNQKSWYDKAFISVSALNGSEAQMTSKTTALSITGGNFDIEGVETFGGKITRVGTRDDIEIQLDGIEVSHQDFAWMFAGQTSSTASAFSATGSTITSSQISKYRLTFLWTNQTGVTGATQAITGSNEAFRRSFCDAYCTSLEPSMDAGDNLKVRMTMKLSPEDDSGLNNWGIWSKDTTSGTLSALNAFTSSTTKW